MPEFGGTYRSGPVMVLLGWIGVLLVFLGLALRREPVVLRLGLIVVGGLSFTVLLRVKVRLVDHTVEVHRLRGVEVFDLRQDSVSVDFSNSKLRLFDSTDGREVTAWAVSGRSNYSVVGRFRIRELCRAIENLTPSSGAASVRLRPDARWLGEWVPNDRPVDLGSSGDA